jgi:hypothetical protein
VDVACAVNDSGEVVLSVSLIGMADVISEAIEVESIAVDRALADNVVARAVDTIWVVVNRVLIM